MPRCQVKSSQVHRARRRAKGKVAEAETLMREAREQLATAREALKRVAANRTGFIPNELETRQGTVIAPDGTVLPYAELAAAAAEIDPPKVTLRDPSSWRYLGKTLPRVDMEDKITGAATFGIDVVLDGMKFASVRMSPRRQGMRRFDASVAKAMPDVDGVLDMGEGVAVIAARWPSPRRQRRCRRRRRV